MKEALSGLLEQGGVTRDIHRRMELADFKLETWSRLWATFTALSVYNRGERAPVETFELAITLDFDMRKIDVELGEDVGYGPEYFESMMESETDVVGWLKRVRDKSPGLSGNQNARAAFHAEVERHPENFNALIEKAAKLEKWLSATEDEIAEAAREQLIFV